MNIVGNCSRCGRIVYLDNKILQGLLLMNLDATPHYTTCSNPLIWKRKKGRKAGSHCEKY